MFKKLLSNLPFNPSLIGQVAFYARRLHRETALRRTGVAIMSLALVLQIFAVTSPPQPSLASSTSDLMVGGFSRKGEVVDYCQKNVRQYKTIAAHYGITCADIKSATETYIHPHDFNDKLHSMGRLSYGVAGEIPVNIPEVGTTYLRHFWSLNHESSYHALKGKTKYGMTFFVLYGCGNFVFIGVPQPPHICKYNDDLLASSPKCFNPCPVAGKHDIPKSSPQCFNPCPYKPSIPANSDNCFKPCDISGKHNIPSDSPDCFEPCKYNSNIASDSPNCKPCKEAQTSTDKTACLEYHKTAANTTQNINNANGTTAHANDTIVYTLTTKNVGKEKIDNYVVNENISDVLDYADVVSLGGGKQADEGVISWPAATIKAGQSITHTFSVKIKDPIPNTPASSSDEAHFDMKMTNVYGDTVEIKLPPSITKSTELVTTQLPNTGPGSSLLIVFSITTIAGYFLSRSRLLAKELDIVRTDYAGIGGN